MRSSSNWNLFWALSCSAKVCFWSSSDSLWLWQHNSPLVISMAMDDAGWPWEWTQPQIGRTGDLDTPTIFLGNYPIFRHAYRGKLLIYIYIPLNQDASSYQVPWITTITRPPISWIYHIPQSPHSNPTEVVITLLLWNPHDTTIRHHKKVFPCIPMYSLYRFPQIPIDSWDFTSGTWQIIS